MNLETLHIRLDHDTIEILRMFARSTGRTLAGAMRYLINKGVKMETPESETK